MTVWKSWHKCTELEQTYKTCLLDAEVTRFTDGSSFMQDGQRYAGVVIVSKEGVIWSEALPIGTSAQWAELISLAKALTLEKNKKLNIDTDSHYTFAIAYVPGAIYREKGLLAAEGKTNKKGRNHGPVNSFLAPQKNSHYPYPGLQKGDGPLTRGNNLAD